MNNNKFSISYEWDVYPDKTEEIGCTSANISILINGSIATSNIDKDSKTTKDRVYLSLYPFALWLANSWWRLNYESTVPKKSSQEYNFWRMAHDLTSAGEGFAWPDIEFITDGESMQILNYKTSYKMASINYINPFKTYIPLSDFSKSSHQLIQAVSARLSEYGLHNTELHQCWQAVIEEQQDPGLREQRIWEARLGFDPGEAPVEIIRRILEKAQQIGSDSLAEVVAASEAANSPSLFDVISGLEQRLEHGINGVFHLPDISSFRSRHTELPWKIGYAMAADVRRKCNFNNERISNSELAGMLGLTEGDLFADSESRDMSIACMTDDNRTKFSFQRGTSAARRFSAARIIADKLKINKNNIWLSATNASTIGQKIQRAFAGELLCPIDMLREFVGKERVTLELLDEAAEHFQVNSLVPALQLHNNDKDALPVDLSEALIPPEADSLIRHAV